MAAALSLSASCGARCTRSSWVTSGWRARLAHARNGRTLGVGAPIEQNGRLPARDVPRGLTWRVMDVLRSRLRRASQFVTAAHWWQRCKFGVLTTPAEVNPPHAWTSDSDVVWRGVVWCTVQPFRRCHSPPSDTSRRDSTPHTAAGIIFRAVSNCMNKKEGRRSAIAKRRYRGSVLVGGGEKWSAGMVSGATTDASCVAKAAAGVLAAAPAPAAALRAATRSLRRSFFALAIATIALVTASVCSASHHRRVSSVFDAQVKR